MRIRHHDRTPGGQPTGQREDASHVEDDQEEVPEHPDDNKPVGAKPTEVKADVTEIKD